MGMAASQARLLTLTSRLHDVEYKAQNIESQKIALATQQDELYQTYCDALEATKIQVAFNNDNGTTSAVDASFATVCMYNENRTTDYTIRDSKTGRVIVDSDVYNTYTQGKFRDKYSFAWAMLGMGSSYSYTDAEANDEYGQGTEVGIGTNLYNEYGYEDVEGEGNLFMTDAERYAFEKAKEQNPKSTLVGLYDELVKVANDSNATDAEKQEALDSFRKKLNSDKSILNDTYDYMRRDKTASADSDIVEYDNSFEDTMDQNKFNYYVRLFEQIQASGGCQEMDAAYSSGEEGKEWFNNMVSSGRVLIDVYNKNKKEWQETSVATSTNENNLSEASDDTELKKAEATYEYELKKINAKDTKYDKELSKLETERNAIKTEIDSIKTVRDDNIDRTFGIFS